METQQLFWTFVSVFKHTQKRFFTFKWNFLCFSLWPLSLYSFCQVFIHVGKLPLSLLFWLSNLNSLSCLNCLSFLTLQMPQSINHLCGLLLDLLQYVCVSVVLGIPEQDEVFQMWPHQGQVEAKDHILGPAGNAVSYCSPGNCWPLLKGHIAGLHSAWYSPGSQVFCCSLNSKNVS